MTREWKYQGVDIQDRGGFFFFSGIAMTFRVDSRISSRLGIFFFSVAYRLVTWPRGRVLLIFFGDGHIFDERGVSGVLAGIDMSEGYFGPSVNK